MHNAETKGHLTRLVARAATRLSSTNKSERTRDIEEFITKEEAGLKHGSSAYFGTIGGGIIEQPPERWRSGGCDRGTKLGLDLSP